MDNLSWQQKLENVASSPSDELNSQSLEDAPAVYSQDLDLFRQTDNQLPDIQLQISRHPAIHPALQTSSFLYIQLSRQIVDVRHTDIQLNDILNCKCCPVSLLIVRSQRLP